MDHFKSSFSRGMINSANIDRNLNPCIGMKFEKAQQWKWVVRIGIRSIPMFRSFHFLYPFLGQSLPTILKKKLIIHQSTESIFVLLLAPQMKKDLSEIAGWVGPTKKGMGVEAKRLLDRSFDHGWRKAENESSALPIGREELDRVQSRLSVPLERSLTAHFIEFCIHERLQCSLQTFSYRIRMKNRY